MPDVCNRQKYVFGCNRFSVLQHSVSKSIYITTCDMSNALKAPTMTGQITLIFQYSLQGARRRQARGAACWDVAVGQAARHALADRTGLARAGPPQAAPLTRRRPGSAAGAPRPGRCCTRCGRGLAGAPLGRRPPRWLLDTGSRALRGERTEQGKGFQTQDCHGVGGPPLHAAPSP